MSEIHTSDIDRGVVIRELFAGIGAVAQAGVEQGLDETELIDLQADTTDRAREIFQQSVQE